MTHNFKVVYGEHRGDMAWKEWHCEATDATAARAMFRLVLPHVWIAYVSLT